MAVKNRVTKLDSQYTRNYDAYLERLKKRRRKLYRRLTLFAIVIIALFSGLISYHLDQRTLYKEKQAEYEQLQKNLEELKAEEKNLLEEINLLQDTEYILQIARRDYFLSKEGEIIFKIPEEEESY
jgi:cell division protein DivIC